MKKLRHSKYKNTGILFEMLVRKLTSEALTSDKSIAIDIIKKYFGRKTELAKELRLYNSVIKEQFKSDAQALDFIRGIKTAYDKLNKSNLRRERYNLVKEIAQHFPIDQISQIRIPNYKSLASAFIIFENEESDNPEQIMRCKSALLESMVVKPKTKAPAPDSLLEQFKSQPKESRMLAYKMLVDKFNTKYSTLDENQKKLLNKYITNAHDIIALKEYVKEIIPQIKNQLASHVSNISDQATKIKVEKLSEILCDVENIAVIKEAHILNLLRYYDLVKELNEVHV